MKDQRIDANIAKSAEFARPIMRHLRKLIHEACPDVTETIKWGMPYFDYKGSVLCSFAAFKNHMVFGFWKESLMSDPHKLFGRKENEAMGSLGQIKSMEDLPSDKILIAYIKEAMKLNEEGKKLPQKTPSQKQQELKVPDYLMAAIRKNKKALETFANFSYTNKKEYVEWITEAKSDETRERRMETAVEWMSEGKIRHWKYMRK